MSVDAELVKQRHGDMKARPSPQRLSTRASYSFSTPQTMLKRWGGWLHEGGVRGKHVTLEQAGASEVRDAASMLRSSSRHVLTTALSWFSCACCAPARLSRTWQEDVVVRYGDDADFDGPVLEFLMRQAEVTSALVRGQAVTKAQFLAAHPELEDEL